MQNYKIVTEISGDNVSKEQVERLFNRYCWANQYCKNKDVLEVACGSGQGLGLINSNAKSLIAGDYSPEVLETALKHYKNKIPLSVFDAQKMPFDNSKFDVIIIFEAIYYLKNFSLFLKECKRVLKDEGVLLISMPNTQLSDFNKSPFSYEYFDIRKLKNILKNNNFESEFFGFLNIKDVSFRQKILRPIKKFAVKLNIIPKTMSGKKLLKKIVFGNLVRMPNEVTSLDCEKCKPIDRLVDDVSNHKVIYCAATLKK